MKTNKHGVSCRIFLSFSCMFDSTAGGTTHKLTKKLNIFNQLKRVQDTKRLNLFWNKLSNKDRERVLLIIGINDKPVRSLTHLKCILALVKFMYKEKWSYGSLE